MSVVVVIGCCIAAVLAAVNSVWAHKRISKLQEQITTEQCDKKAVRTDVSQIIYSPERRDPEHVWTITEKNGRWQWRVEKHYPFWFSPEACASGTAVSRKDAERAVWRWFWRRHKYQVCPPIHAGSSSGSRKVTP